MNNENSKKLEQFKGTVKLTQPTRLWFLGRGFKQVPPELIGGKVLWANEKESYFMNACGVKLKLSFSPAKQKKGRKDNNGKRGLTHPDMRRFGGKRAHRLMFETYAEEPCPIFYDSKGKPYKGIVHHVIENSFDLRMENLMGWLTYEQHAVADKRRRALEAVLPDMYCVETNYLKTLQDPRKTDDVSFENELYKLREKYGTKDN